MERHRTPQGVQKLTPTPYVHSSTFADFFCLLKFLSVCFTKDHCKIFCLSFNCFHSPKNIFKSRKKLGELQYRLSERRQNKIRPTANQTDLFWITDVTIYFTYSGWLKVLLTYGKLQRNYHWIKITYTIWCERKITEFGFYFSFS